MAEIKESGFSWFGQIPKEWDLSKIKYEIIDLYSGGTPESGNYEFYDENGECWVAIGDMSNSNIVYDTEEHITKAGVKDKSLKLVPRGTIIYSIYATIGKVAKLGTDSYINQALLALYPKSTLDKEYLKYNLKFLEQYALSECSISIQNNLNALKVKNFPILKLCLKEQQLIVAFLDDKVNKIDDILNDLNNQIEILNKYKNTIIHEVTSKGINHDRQYQYLGNKWYPQIPIDWRFMPIKRVTSILTCGVAATPEYVNEEEGILFLSAQNIQNNQLDLSIKKYISVELHKKLTKNRKPKKGDILQVRVGATIGKSAIVNIENEFSVYVSLTHIRVNDSINNRFLNYILGTDIFKRMASLDIDYVGTQGNLNVADLKEIKIPVPDIDEQIQIADYLDKKCTEIDELIADKQAQIEKMEKYKQSLIYEYVTGKKRVKGAEELYG